jgi:hypothetical protein
VSLDLITRIAIISSEIGVVALSNKQGLGGGHGSSKELGAFQGVLDLGIEAEAEVDGIGMGVLKDGTAYLTGRGLARLVDMENLHIRTIGSEWNTAGADTRVGQIKAMLAKRNVFRDAAYIATHDKSGRLVHAYPEDVCLAVLEYYAFDAAKPRPSARDNYRLLAGKALRDLIYNQVGYDPSGNNRFQKWHERIALNYQAAPKGYFHVFNEAHTIIYELILAGAEIGEKFVVDISIGQHWSKYWESSGLAESYTREKYPHSYPESHPQSKANPHYSYCYPLAVLGEFRGWLQDVYLEGGKFKKYLNDKVVKGELPPSIAQLAIATLSPAALPPA